ncbi:MAG: DNA recombination protein RmuC [Alphaproteobacteria bacterium]|nr:DNA recombination protein RmuC [Alphaproteobacteria bacterium]
MTSLLIGLALGILLGGAGVWLFLRARIETESQLGDRFGALAAEALRKSNESFLQLAESRLKQSEVAAAATLESKQTAIGEMLKPVKETLGKMDAQLKELEVSRVGAYKELMQAVSLSNETQQRLRSETGQLLQALRTPTARGQWGEIQVRRILEMTGMAEHTHDFSSQHHVSGEDGSIRPDYVVRLPGDKCIVIDSKVPLAAYLDCAQAQDANAKKSAMEKHARQVREHIKILSSKAYWDKVDGAADFVVLFVPGDHILGDALECDPTLFDFGTSNKVVLATPMTLVALLRTVGMSWRQENLRKHSEELGRLGGDLYASVATMLGYVDDLRARLSGSVDAFNKMIGSLERNVLSKARKLRDFGAKSDAKELPDTLEPVEKQTRELKLLGKGDTDAAA